jgi:hypothetical protein
MTRKDFVRGAVGSMAPSLPGSGQRPNVLLVSMGDMNDWVGCLDGCRRLLLTI